MDVGAAVVGAEEGDSLATFVGDTVGLEDVGAAEGSEVVGLSDAS